MIVIISVAVKLEPRTSQLYVISPPGSWIICLHQQTPPPHPRNFNQNTKLFIHENTSENVVCESGGHFVQGAIS